MEKIVGILIFIILRLLKLTYRYHYTGMDNYRETESSNPKKSYVFALWHQNIVATLLGHTRRQHSGIISQSKDGEIIAIPVKKMGHLPVRGSSTRGGKAAMEETIRLITAEGIPGAVTVDGPVGPPHVVKPGIIEIARRARCPIQPVAAIASKFWTINSWDKFRIPKPFCKIIVHYGKPIYIAEKLSKEEFDRLRVDVKNALDESIQSAQSELEQNSQP